MHLDFPVEEQQNKNKTLTVYEERLERCMCVPNNDIINYQYYYLVKKFATNSE